MTEDNGRSQDESAEARGSDPMEPERISGTSDGAEDELIDEGEVPLDELTGELAEPATDAVERLRAERDELTERSAKLRDQLLRTAADFDNFRKRAVKQEEATATRAVEETLRAVLPVIDNLERAMAYAEASDPGGKVLEGLRLVLRGFSDAFASRRIERFGSVGHPFDPSRHEAISQMETAEHPPGVVVQEYQAGWMLGDRLLRPAMVVVARPPREEAAPPAASDETGAGASPEEADPEAKTPAAEGGAVGGPGPEEGGD